MRRREKFVLAAILLSIGLLFVQYVSLEWRYVAVAVFGVVTYLVSMWALRDDLQRFELLTIVPFPAIYSLAVGVFYFLLPESWLSRALILVLFGVGMYSIYLTSNIYSVAKGRTIQLLHAAHAIGLFFTIFTSLLFLNTIFSLRLPFYLNGLLVTAVHFPISFLFLWAVHLEQRIDKALVQLAWILALIMGELAIAFSFIPFSLWNTSLLLMTVYYIGLGILQNYLKSRLFQNTIYEYSAVAIFAVISFFLLLPGK